jgi:hypothetical protein
MAEEARYDVFLSHNSADKPAVEELARRLIKASVQPWLDTWNLIPGEPFQEAIEEALDRCAMCAVFVGPSGTGPWQNEEMRAAIQRRVEEGRGGERPFRVIPVLLPGAERGERGRLPGRGQGGRPRHAAALVGPGERERPADPPAGCPVRVLLG